MISAVIRYADDKISIHSSEATEVGVEFTKGFYEASFDGNGNLIILAQKLEELHNPYKTLDNTLIINTVESFFKDEIQKKVNTLGFTHKLGILFHGSQGCGKTSLMHFIAKKLVEEHKGIVFFCNSSNSLSAAIGLAKNIREIQQNPIIFIADEFERYCRDTESEIKNFLDGNTSINNTLFLAATNYLEKVPDTLKKRPSRFKIVQEIKGIEDKQLISTIISNIFNKIQPGLFTEEEIKDVVKEISHITLDEIKHICLDKVTDNYVPKLLKKTTIGFKKEKDVNPEDMLGIPKLITGYINSTDYYAIRIASDKSDSNV